MGRGRLVIVLIITNVEANGEVEQFLIIISVGWWEPGGDVDGYKKASVNIDVYGDVFVVSDGGIDEDVGRY